ncbi:hypothetical protein KM043_005295 [Ampulex compressa]|nr:hypothetical protein KM043_005295 [Ampulex compressa]
MLEIVPVIEVLGESGLVRDQGRDHAPGLDLAHAPVQDHGASDRDLVRHPAAVHAAEAATQRTRSVISNGPLRKIGPREDPNLDRPRDLAADKTRTM